MIEGYTPDALKILIVSTPKTGNTWLKYLLATAYALPVVEFSTPEFWLRFDEERYDKLGSRWVAHQHFPPFEPFVRWARDRGIVLITTVRHPADTLVSLLHYIENFAGKAQIDPETVGLLNSGEEKERGKGSSTLQTLGLEKYVREKFFKALHFSISWLQRGLSFGVRYEDLWYSPVRTLEALTDNIHPIPSTRIQATVENCRLENMRTAAGQDASFFRGGGAGGWKTSLPPSAIQSLRELPPYLLQSKWLGYSLNSVDQVPDGSSEYALKGADSDSSYFSWVNAAADDDPHAGRIAPLITQLGAYLYHSRRDLLEIFPDPYGRDRVAFSHWFTELSQVGSKRLDVRFLIPVYESWLQGPPPNFAPVHLPQQATRASHARSEYLGDRSATASIKQRTAAEE